MALLPRAARNAIVVISSSPPESPGHDIEGVFKSTKPPNVHTPEAPATPYFERQHDKHLRRV